MNGSSTAITSVGARTGSGSTKNNNKKNKSHGVFLKQRRQHLRRWRFARNGRRAKRRKHREARSRRKHPWYWASSSRRVRYTKDDAEHTKISNQQNFYQRQLKSQDDSAGELEALVYGQGETGLLPAFRPTLSIVATSIVMTGLRFLAKLPWIVLKSILRRFNDYILTPPEMEERSKSKLHHHLYMFCRPFLPCWATVKCSACRFEHCGWDESDEGSDDFCVLGCPRTECQKHVVKCRHCRYNFPLNDERGDQGQRRESDDYRLKRMMKWHMRDKHAKPSGYVPTLSNEHNHPGNQEAEQQASGDEEVFYDDPNGGGDFGDEEDMVDDDRVPGLLNRQLDEEDDDTVDTSDTESETESETEESDDDVLEMFAFLLQSTIYEKEEEEAEAYVSQFRESDLDPNTPGVEELNERSEGAGNATDHSHLHHVKEGQYKYSDFHFFDRRTEEEKQFRPGSARDRLCQAQLYFYQKYQLQLLNANDGTGGFAGLTQRALSRNREDSSNPYYKRYVQWNDQVNTETENTVGNPRKELRQMHRMLNLLMGLTDTQKKELLDFHRENLEIFNVESVPNDIKFYYPTNWQDARAILLDGAHSILKNFPVPRVFEISGRKDGLMNTEFSHACVGLEETLLLAAGHGASFNFNYDSRREKDHEGNPVLNMEGLNGTQAMHDLKGDIIKAMQEDGQSEEVVFKTSIGYVYFWSDAFLRCFVKQKDNSVWVLTVTVCPHESDKANGANTFILAIGKSGKEVDHSPVVTHYVEECQRLMKGFDCYFGDTNEIGRMAVGMLTWNADRPERQSISNTRQEGHYGKVTGWAAKVSEEKFPACLGCHRRRVIEMLGGTEDEEEEHAPHRCDKCLDWTLDKNVGNEEQKTDKPSRNYPQGLEVEGRRMMDEAPPGRLPGQRLLGPIKQRTEWMIKALKTAYYGLRYGSWGKANTQAYLQSCNVGGAAVDEVVNLAHEDLRNDACSEPQKYIPKFWTLFDCFSRFRLPDLPMHGLAHGIIPDVMDINDKVLKRYSLGLKFYKFGNKTMNDVASFRLDWCKVKSLPKAAWVSENCMAHMRLMSYIYGMFFSHFNLSTEETEHTRETVSNMKRLVNSLQALMSVLMSKDKPDKRVTDNHMRLLMSSADFLHKQHGSLDTSKPKGKKGRVVDKLTPQELLTIVNSFQRTVEDATPATLKNEVDGIVVNDLKAKCRELHLGTSGRKPELQIRVFERILSRSIMEEAQTQGGQDQAGTEEGERPKKEGMCWNKGNWLSFLTNISDQIEYLGPLTWIW